METALPSAMAVLHGGPRLSEPLQWGHGHYKGRETRSASSCSIWRRKNENAFDRLHVQAFSKVTLESGPAKGEGCGVLEQLVFGPHRAFGLQDLLDVAP